MPNPINLPSVTVTAGSTAAVSAGVILADRIHEDDELVVAGISARILSASFQSGQNWSLTLKDAWKGTTASQVAGYVRVKADAARFTEEVTAFINLLQQIGLWLPTSGTPTANYGKDGDIAVDGKSLTFYRKSEGAWSTVGSAIGSIWHSGSGVPSAQIGSNNDFYLRSTGQVYIKAAGVWQSTFSLTGPPGPASTITGGSTASADLSVGSKPFTISAALASSLGLGQRVRIANTAAPTSRYMEGTIEAKTGNSITVAIDPQVIVGQGTYADWTISIAGQRGADGTGVGDMVKAEYEPIIGAKLDKSGGTLTGPLVLSAAPSVTLGAATKGYVDSEVNSAVAGVVRTTTSSSNTLTNYPVGTMLPVQNTGGGNYPRNAVMPVHLTADGTGFRSDAAGGQCSGTWRSRGFSGDRGVDTITVIMAERVL